jgi:hypothetical protein
VAEPDDSPPKRVIAAQKIVTVKEKPEARPTREREQNEPPPNLPIDGLVCSWL